MPQSKIVIDASIARAAGETTHPTSKNCRDCLNQIKDCKHMIVFTDKIQKEWNNHLSTYAGKWLVAMKQGRNRVCELELAENADFRKHINNHSLLILSEKRAALKDIHLIEAAKQTDELIMSLDETARSLFKTIAINFRDIQTIVWSNPNKSEENICEWIHQGFPNRSKRQLYSKP